MSDRILVFNQPLDELVNRSTKSLPWLDGEWSKVRGHLEGYAADYYWSGLEKWQAVSRLPVDKVCRSDWTLTCELTGYLQQQGWTADYLHQEQSRIRRIVRKVVELLSASKEGGDIIDATGAPEFLSQVISLLSEKNADLLWRVFVCVSTEHNLTSLESLLVEYSSAVRRAIKQLGPPNLITSATNEYWKLRQHFGFEGIRKTKVSVDLADLPSPLKEECEIFFRKAPRGLEADRHLRKRAAKLNFNLGPIKDNTAQHYFQGISIAIGTICPPENFGVSDLLAICPKGCGLPGHNIKEDHNYYVDLFREKECGRETSHKKEGYDSSTFCAFINGIRAVAVFNDHFELVQPFLEVYAVQLDHRTKERIKDMKKKLFDTEWLNSEIHRLRREFKEIIKNKSFVINPERTNIREATRAMRLCLFFVLLVVLRYTGMRQQALRDCKLGENIKLPKRGKLTLAWDKKQVKQSRDILICLDRVLDRGAFEILIETLDLYHDFIYPYIVENAGEDLRGQIFVKFGHDYRFYAFGPEGHKDFYQWFQRLGYEFLIYGDRLQAHPQGLNPHFLRGFAMDWIVLGLKVSINNAAEFFGVSVKTLTNIYLRKDRSSDSEPALQEIRQNSVEKEKPYQAEHAFKDQRLKDQMLEEALKHASFMEGEVVRERQRREQAEADKAALSVEIKSLRAQQAHQVIAG
jgi:hypothetical protein